MIRLSRPIELMQQRYDVVVVGSGYGGGIAASRMARARRSVCLLERGKELHPGEYPDELNELREEFQITTPHGHFGPRTGMYDMRVHQDMSVFLGCGLGGTSLVNANVALQADPRVFDDHRWPAELRADRDMDEYYDLARRMLGSNPLPDDIHLDKLDALEASGKAWHGRFSRPPINVTFEDNHLSQAGVLQHRCQLCGDCVSGCNFWAKNTTLMNYLPDACNHGAEIYTRVPVRWVEQCPDGWQVHYQILDSGQETFDAPTQFVTAGIVILGAGALGTTEILLRSQGKGLATSAMVGRSFTGNGDVLGFSYDTHRTVDGIGWGTRRKPEAPDVGPCITGVIDLRNTDDVTDGMVIEEGSIPGGLRHVIPAAMAVSDALLGQPEGRHHYWEKVHHFLLESHAEAARRTQTYLVMAHDSGSGQLALNDDDQLEVRWPGVATEPVFARIRENLIKATEEIGGDFLEDPISEQHLHDLITVHPLGGCPMGDTGAAGAVNHLGQVYSGAGAEVHEGLYACDGSVIPLPLGVNPLLTISALAERTCRHLADAHGWQLETDAPSSPPPGTNDSPGTVGIQFTERLSGFFAQGAADFQPGEEAGKAAGSSIAFILTIASENVNALIDDPTHAARMVGVVQAPALSAAALEVSDGAFNLFVQDQDQPDRLRMLYAMRLHSEEGRDFFFSGFKKLVHDRPFDVWSDTTTLYVTIHAGTDSSAPVLGRGIMHIKPSDFARQLTTMHALNAPSKVAGLAALERFGRLFAGTLYHVYGSLFPKHRLAAPTITNPDAGGQ